MSLFNEIYSAYYNAVAKIIKTSVDHNITQEEILEIVGKYAFEESSIAIPAALRNQDWQLLNKDGSTNILKEPKMPLTTLQKRWLAAIRLDPRIALFGDDIKKSLDFPDVQPLFKPEDIVCFDQYLDGDDYEDPNYIRNFRTILSAVKNKKPLQIDAYTRSGQIMRNVVVPDTLEYSEKDDKFRLICCGFRGLVYNLKKIVSCEIFEGEVKPHLYTQRQNESRKREVVFELTDDRKALERVLLHFAHLEKNVIKIDDRKYQVRIIYDKCDETEIVIRILSFGPNVLVLGPSDFKRQIISRLKKQMSCEH